MEEWKAELETFYETEGTKKVIKELNTMSAVMITGNSGIGKTTTMKYVSLLFEKKGYEVVPISSPNDILHHRFPERNQIFILDDIVGKYRVDNVAVESWRRLYDRLRVVFKDKNVKLLSTLRRQVHAEIRSSLFPYIFNSTVVDLDSKKIALSLNEKQGMLKNYLKVRRIKTNLDDEEILKISSCGIAFPLLCNLFTTNQEFLKMQSKFFQSPSIVFKEELNRLQIENKEVYCVLVLLVILHLEELQTIFNINCEKERTVAYNTILRACEVPENISRKTLHRHLQTVAGTFVETTNIFKFQHDKLEETIACHFGSQFPDIMLQYCKLDFIRDRVRLSHGPADDENILVLQQTSFDGFSRRVLGEIIKGRFRDILLSEPMQCEKLIEHFAFYIQKNQLDFKGIENALCTETFVPSQQHEVKYTRFVSVASRFALLEELQNRKKRFIHWVAAMGCIQLFTIVFKMKKNKYIHNLITDLLHLAVSGENIDVVKMLIDEGGDLKSYDEFGIPLICKIASTNRCDIAKLLIDKGADVNQTDEIYKWTPCFVATWFNEIEMLKFLISRGANINEHDCQLRVPLVIAVSRNYTEAVVVLLKNGAEIYDCFEIWNFKVDIEHNFNSVLEEALINNNPKIIKLLTDFMEGRNFIVMHFPKAIRRSDIKRKLVNIFLTEIQSYDSKHPLWNDFISICFAIYRNDKPRLENIFANISIKKRKMMSTFDDNYLRFCPLHVSAACDNTTAATFLIQNGADPFQRDDRGRTSLHLANSASMLKILLSTTKKPTNCSTFSQFDSLSRILKFFITFEIVPFVFKYLTASNSDRKANVKDIHGNTPIHSMIITISSPKKCLNAVSTLLQNNADINIRSSSGYLPIDLFKMVYLRYDESVIKRGERLLGGHKHKSFVKKEKLYYGILSAIFIVLHILFCFNTAESACFRKENSPESNKIKQSYLQCMTYIQIIYMFLLHHCWLVFFLNVPYFPVPGVDTKLLRSKLYSDKLFVKFSEKVGLAFLCVCLIALKFDDVYSAYVFFNVYCVLICTFFCIMYIPNSYRNWVRKHHGIILLSLKISLVSCLGILILKLLLEITYETQTCTNNIVVDLFTWSELLLFFIVKVITVYIFIFLFIRRLFAPLLITLLQPQFFYRQYIAHLISVAYLLFLVVEVLLVPLTLVFCDIPNC